MKRVLVGAAGAAALMLVVSSSWAAEPAVEGAHPVPDPEPLDKKESSTWDHFEGSMGFLVGERRYDRSSFEWKSGGDDLPGARSLTGPFLASPYDRLLVGGLRYDLRLVVSYVRMTAGIDVPFALNRPSDAMGDYDVGGATRRIVVTKFQPVDLRFGIGAEYPIGPVAPFVDVMGSVHWVDAQLGVGDTPVEYKSTAFGLSGRAGVRLHVRRWFFAAAAGEVGFVGDLRWGAELSVGFAAM